MGARAEATKRALLEAALAEFAAYGCDGTTVERIARRAGVNKERIYNYFGDKNDLFVAVLQAEMTKLAAAVPFDVIGSDAGELAGRMFDYSEEHPHLARLLLWEGLSDTGRVPDETSRAQHYRAKVAAVEAGQAAGSIDDDLEPADVVFFITALTGWWQVVPHLARMIHTHPDDQAAVSRSTESEHTRRRAATIDAVRRLTARPAPNPVT